MAELFAILMFAAACAGLLGGYTVAFTLGGIGLFFAALAAGLSFITETAGFDTSILISLPGRIYPLLTKEILFAVPLFVFMGVMLERSRIAEDLLGALGDLFGPMRGGLGIAVVLVGALLAASTGIVGATVVTMGLLSLPTMLQRGYAPSLAGGSIAASGTLGQIIPPSIVLVILGDQLSNAFQEAQRIDPTNTLIDTDRVVSVGQLFAGALIPGMILVGFYALYIALVAWRRPAMAPAQPWPEGVSQWTFIRRLLVAMVPPILLIVLVLGSILAGYATPTRGAAIGAVGAILLASFRLSPDRSGLRKVCWVAVVAVAILIAIKGTGIDIRTGHEGWTGFERLSFGLALLASAALAVGILWSCLFLYRNGQLADVCRSTLHITSMVFVILIGATIFSLVFAGFGGDDMVARALDSVPGGPVWSLIAVMVVMFLLGFFLDFIEITFVIVPLVAPPLFLMGIDPVWLGIMMALNLQTSFLTPPFGFALFYLRGVASPELTTTALYRGVLPFIAIQIIVLLMVAAWPSLAIGLS